MSLAVTENDVLASRISEETPPESGVGRRLLRYSPQKHSKKGPKTLESGIFSNEDRALPEKRTRRNNDEICGGRECSYYNKDNYRTPVTSGDIQEDGDEYSSPENDESHRSPEKKAPKSKRMERERRYSSFGYRPEGMLVNGGRVARP